MLKVQPLEKSVTIEDVHLVEAYTLSSGVCVCVCVYVCVCECGCGYSVCMYVSVLSASVHKYSVIYHGLSVQVV